MDLFSTSQSDSDLTFNLARDIVFFDIESTGLNVMKDRIVQIALIKHFVDGRPPVELTELVNPGVPISDESMAIHGITPDDVKNKPTFAQLSQKLYEFIGDADLAGYNSDRFDIPMLTEEFHRCGIDLDVENRRTIDVQKIFYKMEPRTLRAAYSHYCGQTLTDAHDALADVRATVEVLKGQIKMYEGVDYEDGDGFITKAPIQNDMDALYEFTHDDRVVDFTNRLKKNHKGEIVFNFGKYMNKEIKSVLRRDRNYYHWIMEKDFSSQVKKIVSRTMNEIITESQKGI